MQRISSLKRYSTSPYLMNPNPTQKVVTRYAPSPTGFTHVGGVRTALYAWLYARKHGGTFILRIEDTDKKREVVGAIEHVVESLHWLGLDWDEGVDVGGPHAPYKQSERLASYKKYAQVLIEKGCAYPDPYTEEEVAVFRQDAETEKHPFLYREHRPETFGVWDGTRPLRFKVPEIKRYTWHDLVRGELSAGEEALDDFILIKSDGYPTYNFAHIIDDFEMDVTHIMRGQEFISSMPIYLSLYEALGIERPHFATVPPIMAMDGKKKLGKRDGAKDVLDYRREGYLPEAMLNFLAFIGWNPGDEREVLSAAEIIEAFSFEHMHSAGAKFNEEKLLWFNHEHIKRLSDEAFFERLTAYMNTLGPILAYLPSISGLLKERSRTLAEAVQAIADGEFSFLEETIETPSQDLLLKGAKTDVATAKKHLEVVRGILENQDLTLFSAEQVKELIFPYATEQGRSAVLWPLRVALTGKEKSPDPFTVAELLGKEKTLTRIASALAVL